MRQARNFFPEENFPNRNFAVHQPKKFFGSFFAPPGIAEEKPAEIAITQSKDDSVRYFDLVTQSSAFRSARFKETNKTKEPLCASASQNKNSFFIAPRDFAFDEKFSPAGKSNLEELLELLLFYFDQIVYLSEMSEKLGEMDVAVSEENIAKVNAAARDCIEISGNCEMTAAIVPLRQLTYVKTKLQMTDAAFLINQVRKEVKSFRLSLRENLEQLKKQFQLNNSTVVS
jgi:hypothetical protein